MRPSTVILGTMSIQRSGADSVVQCADADTNRQHFTLPVASKQGTNICMYCISHTHTAISVRGVYRGAPCSLIPGCASQPRTQGPPPAPAAVPESLPMQGPQRWGSARGRQLQCQQACCSRAASPPRARKSVKGTGEDVCKDMIPEHLTGNSIDTPG